MWLFYRIFDKLTIFTAQQITGVDRTRTAISQIVRYLRVPRLFEDLTIARADGRYLKLLRDFTRSDLVLIDDFGLIALNADASQRA